MSLLIREMIPDDYEPVIALWQGCEGIGLSSADEREPISRYLAHNPGMSFVAFLDGRLVGAVLCGHDGRRGYLHHLAVDPAMRGQGIGRALSERCLAALARAGIHKCHIFVYENNEDGLAFWEKGGWVQRHELMIMSHDIAPDLPQHE